MNKLTTFLLVSGALALSACANQGRGMSEERDEPVPAKASAKHSHLAGSPCRSLGEGRKINNKGQNDIYMCKANAALNSAEAKEVLSSPVRVSYGSTSGKTNVSRQIANAVGKTPEEACQRAFLSAVKRFQSTAERYRKNSVRLVSYFDKKTVGGSEYECHIGTWNSRVVLKGSFH